MAPSLLRSALILGLLSAVGPFSIDMYLPAMPAIGESLGAPVASVQGTITAFFLAFGISQLFYGPWADMAGRKPPLVFGLCLFAAASVACALAPDIAWLTAARFVQGLGAAVVDQDLGAGTETVWPDREYRVFALLVLAQLGANAGQQHGDAERLGDIVIGARLEAENGVRIAILRRQHDDRAGKSVLAQQLAGFAAIHIRQPDIEQDQIDLLLLGAPDTGPGGGFLDDLEFVIEPQLLRQRLAQIVIVVDNQYPPRPAHGHVLVGH